MPSAIASPTSPRLALAIQSIVLAVVVAIAEFAPRSGTAALYLPLVPATHHTALTWALANGGALNGPGRFSGQILIAPPPGFAARALSEGALAIAIPSFLCQPPETRSHG